ncbi:MAG TPA: amidohydrolase family protein [Rectinema sp.]|nr:amidohydrolase family protein [Rectinema sp.]HRU03931.1 amidohydrolase family protein [Rectinema sp.]
MTIKAMNSYATLIDLQVNGYGGIDFSAKDLTVEQVVYVCQILQSKGTSRFLATLVSSPQELYERNLVIIRQAMQKDETAARLIAGFHIEGPFISEKDGARGAHDKRFICKPDKKMLKCILKAGGSLVRILTIAPELTGIEDIIAMAKDENIIVSMGHTLADASQIERAIEKGASCVTHLGNGIPLMLHRTDNTIFAFLAHTELTIMLITDGHHLPVPFIRTVIRACGINNIVVISDSAPLAGMPPGSYISLGGNVILEPDGKLFIPSQGCLAGSSACIAECANYLKDNVGLSTEEIQKVTSTNPMRLLREDG